MIPYEFIIDEDLDYSGKWEDYDDKIIINCSKIHSELELIDTIFHEDMHAIIAYAAYPVETTPEQDHHMIRKLSFE